jgi:hypothetical protein
MFIDEGMERDLQALARCRNVPVSALVRESLAQYLAGQNGQSPLRFLGRGRSGRTDIAAHHEDLLWRELTPHGSKPGKRRSA